MWDMKWEVRLDRTLVQVWRGEDGFCLGWHWEWRLFLRQEPGLHSRTCRDPDVGTLVLLLPRKSTSDHRRKDVVICRTLKPWGLEYYRPFSVWLGVYLARERFWRVLLLVQLICFISVHYIKCIEAKERLKMTEFVLECRFSRLCLDIPQESL